MITVTAEPQRKLVRAHMSGFLTAQEVADFSRQEQSQVRSMGLTSGEFYLLIETSGEVTQSQEVVAAFQRLITDSEFKSKRMAIVRKGVLTRIQTTRTNARHESAGTFDNLADAERWLFDDGVQAPDLNA